jgi:integrase
MRGGEVKRLRIGSVDVEARRVVIRRAGANADSSARIIDLNRDGLEAVQRLLLRAKSLGASEPEHFLLPRHLSRIKHGPEKGALGYDVTRPQIAWDSAWASLTKKAGLPGFRFHDLRHCFVTHMVERGIPLAVVQSMVGHISARMTRHYLHIASGVARRAVEILDSEP